MTNKIDISNFLENINDIIKKVQKISELKYLKTLNQNCIRLKREKNCFCIYDEDTVELYRKTVRDVWQNLDEKAIEKIYFKYFCDKFADLIIDAILKKINLSANDIKKFMDGFCNIPEESYTMITHIYGFALKEGNSVINLGNYMICDYSYFVNILSSKYKLSSFNNVNTTINEIDNCFIIHKNILAIDNEKAKYIFFDKIEKFINAMLFFCSYYSEENSKISYKNYTANIDCVIISNNNQSTSSIFQNDSLFNPLYYLSQEFIDKNNIAKIFEDIDNYYKLNKLQKRIILAIFWIGQSLRNNNLQQRYTFLNIALETLLSNKTRGIMDQSITHRLREFAAYLGAEHDDIKKRKEIYSKISNLYNMRSQISHQGFAKNLKIKDYLELLDIVYAVTKNVLSLTASNCEDEETLEKYVNKLKGLE